MEDEILFPEILSFAEITRNSSHSIRISKAKRRHLRKWAKASLVGKDDVAELPSDAPPTRLARVGDEDVYLLLMDNSASLVGKDEVVEWPSDKPPTRLARAGDEDADLLLIDSPGSVPPEQLEFLGESSIEPNKTDAGLDIVKVVTPGR